MQASTPLARCRASSRTTKSRAAIGCATARWHSPRARGCAPRALGRTSVRRRRAGRSWICPVKQCSHPSSPARPAPGPGRRLRAAQSQRADLIDGASLEDVLQVSRARDASEGPAEQAVPRGQSRVPRAADRRQGQLVKHDIHRDDPGRQGGDDHGVVWQLQGGGLLHPPRLRQHRRHGVAAGRPARDRPIEWVYHLGQRAPIPPDAQQPGRRSRWRGASAQVLPQQLAPQGHVYNPGERPFEWAEDGHAQERTRRRQLRLQLEWRRVLRRLTPARAPLLR